MTNSRRALRLSSLPPTLVAGALLLAILIVVAAVAPAVLGEASEKVTGAVRQRPSAEHLLGTDQLGRDIFARSLVATRLTLLMAAGATVVQVILGVLIGAAVWIVPRRTREFVLRVIDAAVAFPALVLALVIAAVLGAGTTSAMIAIGVAGIPSFARLAANMVAVVAQRDYVTTARLLGVRGPQLLFRHLIPNVSGPLLILMTSSFALALLDIASLSFVGLGVQGPQFDWGLLLNDGLTAIYTQPWQAIAPSIMLVFAGIAVMLFGDGFAIALDPSLRRRVPIGRKRVFTRAMNTQSSALVEVTNLQVQAPNGSQLVRGVSFTIDHGEIVGLVGESGSGKSMTAMALAGLLADGLKASADVLRLDDMDLTKRNSSKRLATEIGLVYQDPGTTFNPALRMGYQLGEIMRTHMGMSRRDTRQRVADALEQVRVRDVSTRMDQHPFEWSGGMLQRATIASAMGTDPRLLIADEPTTALDVTVQADVLRQFRRINHDRGTAMLFISHDIGVVEVLCDTVLVMKNGEIVERLTGTQLAARTVTHPYTRKLLAAAPTLDDKGIHTVEASNL